jgi:hypothetical protein
VNDDIHHILKKMIDSKSQLPYPMILMSTAHVNGEDCANFHASGSACLCPSEPYHIAPLLTVSRLIKMHQVNLYLGNPRHHHLLFSVSREV